MAVPTESYMKLIAGSDNTHSDIYSSSRIKIGILLKSVEQQVITEYFLYQTLQLIVLVYTSY